MHGLLRCNINAGVHARRRSGRVTQRCHNRPDRKQGKSVRVTSRTGSARRIWGILKKSVSWVLPRKKTVDFRLLVEALRRVRTFFWGGTDRKASIERLCISLPYVETFNSKVIKGFVPELRSRYLFFVFRDSYVLCIYLWTFYVRFTYPYYGYGTVIIVINITAAAFGTFKLLNQWDNGW